jgi:membrane-associated protein
MSATLLSLLQHFSYAGLFGLLAVAAIISPLPEEIVLLTAGYLVAAGVIGWVLGLIVAVAGLLTGDAFLFYLARLGGSYAQKLRTRINKIGLENTWIFSPKQPLRAVFLLRFLTGFRFIAPIYAGFEGVLWRRYLLVDAAAIVVFVPLMFGLGYYFHSSIIAFIAGFEVVRHILFLVVLGFAGAGMLPVLYRFLSRHTGKRRKSKVPKK